jgi:hypothetical protein
MGTYNFGFDELDPKIVVFLKFGYVMMIPCSLWSEMIWNWSDNLDQKIN